MKIDKIVAIIPASGVGLRFSYSKPKQYFPIFGKSILRYTIELLAQNKYIDLIVLNIQQDDKYYCDDNIVSQFIKIIHNKDFQLKKRDSIQCPLITIRQGGSTRSQTVKNAIEFLQKKNLVTGNDWILVHDAVRCVLPINLLRLFITTIIKDKIGGVMAIPAIDTLKKVENNKIISTIDRENVWQAQTPQMFRLHILLKAFENINFFKYTDESSLIESLNIKSIIVMGDLSNIKLTRNEDIKLISLLLSVRNHV